MGLHIRSVHSDNAENKDKRVEAYTLATGAEVYGICCNWHTIIGYILQTN